MTALIQAGGTGPGIPAFTCLAVIWASLSLLVAGCFPASSSRTASPAAVKTAPTVAIVDPPRPVTTEGPSLTVGVTHAAASADPWGNPAAVRSARAVLAGVGGFQAQSIMGWGVGNPEPSPGVFDWSGLDRRMALIRSTGGIPVITLCGAPDWMAGYQAGETDWSRLGEAPTPAHDEDFAQLAVAVARRYPDVRYYQVWNELKGYWDAKAGQWDAAAYTELYNDVYRALKRVNPSIQVGGPYVALSDAPDPSQVGLHGPWGSVDRRAMAALIYWLDHMVGADFVAVDADAEPSTGPAGIDPFEAVGKFAAVDDWLRATTRLPIWWSEFYVQPGHTQWTPAHQAAVLTAALGAMDRSGANVALLWGPEEDGQGGQLGYLWTSSRQAGGGQPTPLAACLAAFNHRRSHSAGAVVVNESDKRAAWHGQTLTSYQVLYTGS